MYITSSVLKINLPSFPGFRAVSNANIHCGGKRGFRNIEKIIAIVVIL